MIADDLICDLAMKGEEAVNPDRLRGKIARSTFLKVQNVCDYIFMENPKEYWDWEEDFPCITPPFPSIWMEWTGTKYSISETKTSDRAERLPNGTWKTYADIRLNCGVLLETNDITKASGHLAQVIDSIKNFVGARRPRWMIRASYFAPGSPMPYIGTFSYLVDDKGRFIFSPAELVSWSYILMRTFTPDVLEDKDSFKKIIADYRDNEGLKNVAGMISSGFKNVVFMALSLMNCKNVEMKKDVIPLELQKSRSRKSKVPVDKFYTLVIDPFAAPGSKSVNAGGGEISSRRSLHICRGHFKTYYDRPLFGKIRGTFWVPMHVKGNASSGTIKKDYEIKGSAN